MARRVVLIGFPCGGAPDAQALPAPLLQRLQAIDPDAEVVYAPVPTDKEMLSRMRSGERSELLPYSDRFPAEFLRALPDTEVLFTLVAPVDLLERAPNLKWVANAGSGTEQYNAHGILGSHVLLSSAKGVAARTVAEFAISQLLLLARNWPARISDQRAHRWQWRNGRELDTMTLGIVGLGEIGREIARMAKVFGMKVVGSRRRAAELPPNVDAVYGPAQLREMLGQCDAVVLAAAFGPQTAGMFDRDTIAAMRRGSYLLNVARGGLVHEGALTAALREGHLAGAAFDVFSEEPLPPESPLWDVPNLVISAHNAVGLQDYAAHSLSRFMDDYADMRAGRPVRGRVDPATGY
jgi:phosphoglycerate dehydrogenase-like enzyme